MKLTLFSIPLSLVFMLTVLPAFAEVPKEALTRFSKGEYIGTLELLKKAPQAEQDPANQYWRGQCYFKLQRFDDAVKAFSVAVQGGASKEFKDAVYLLGQSQYAVQNYPAAQEAFQKSANANYKRGESLYYVAYLQNVQDQDQSAVQTFEEVLKLGDDDKEMKQPAQFQIGEIYFERAKRFEKEKTPDAKAKRDKLLREHAIPAYENVVKMDETKALANQAKGRLAEIRGLMSADVEKSKAGLPAARQPWMVSFTQDFKYDSNITNTADGRLTSVSFHDAFYSKSDLLNKYEWVLNKIVTLTPEFDANFTVHSRRKLSAVYSNDAANLNPAVRSRIDHTVWGRSASGLAELEGAYMIKDYESKHKLRYYNKSLNLVLGERAQVFTIPFLGQTTLKGNFKLLWNQNPKQNYWSPGVSLVQNWTPTQGHSLTSTFGFEAQNAKDPFYHQKTYKINLSYNLPQLGVWGMGLDLALNTTFTDTMSQSKTRGTEKTLNPSLTLNKVFNETFSANFNYGYTRNYSKDSAGYRYSKHVAGLGGSVKF